MNKFFFIAFTLLFFKVKAQDFIKTSQPAWVQEQIVAFNQKSQSLSSSFVQEKHMSILNKPFVSAGEFYYKQPDKVRWQYNTPFSYTVILVNNHITIKDGKDLQSYDMSKNASFKEINRMMSGLVSGRMIEDKNFESEIFENNTNYRINLKPKLASMQNFMEKVYLYFDKNTFELLKIELFEKEGDKTIIKFENTKINNPINDQVFTNP